MWPGSYLKNVFTTGMFVYVCFYLLIFIFIDLQSQKEVFMLKKKKEKEKNREWRTELLHVKLQNQRWKHKTKSFSNSWLCFFFFLFLPQPIPWPSVDRTPTPSAQRLPDCCTFCSSGDRSPGNTSSWSTSLILWDRKVKKVIRKPGIVEVEKVVKKGRRVPTVFKIKINVTSLRRGSAPSSLPWGVACVLPLLQSFT